MPFLDRLIAGPYGGRFSVSPATSFAVGRRYREDSNVVEQVFTTGAGPVRVTSSRNSGISGRLPWTELATRIEGLEGEVHFDIELVLGRRRERATPWREASPHGDVSNRPRW